MTWLSPPSAVMRCLYRRRPPYWLGTALSMALALAWLWAGIAWNLTQEHRRAETGVRAEAVNLAHAFEENLSRSIEAIDQQLLLIRELYIRDPDHFDLSTAARGGYLLRDLTLQIGIIGPNGFVRASNLGPVSAPVDLSDREHFRVHLNSTADFLFISKPVLGRVSHTRTVQFTRKILDANGRFAGMLVVSLDPQKLSRFHQSLEIGPSSLWVVGQDAVVRASSPVANYIGQDISGARLLSEATRQKKGVFLGQAVPGSPRSFVGYRTLPEFPLLVAVGLDAEAAFAPYRQNLWWQLGAGLSLSLLILAGGGMLIRARAEQHRTMDMVQRLIDTSPWAMIGLTQNRQVTIWNHSAERIFGYTAPDVLGQPYPLIPPEEQQGAELLFARTMRGESLQNLETRRQRKDGTIIDVRFSGTTFRPGGKGASALLFMVEDITERKRAAERVRESAARLRGFLAASPDAIIAVDETAHIVLASERTAAVFGYRPEELTGQPLDLLLPEHSHAAHAASISTYLRAPRVREMGIGTELRARRHDGSEFPAEISLSPYRNDTGLFVIAAVRDITKRHQALAELRLSEARFRSAFEAAGHGMAWIGLDERFLKVNAAYCRITGYSEAELLARAVRDITHPDDVAESWANVCRVAAGEIPFYQAEKRYIRKDGAIIWAQLNTGVVRDAAGAPLHFISQIQDITEQRHAEERLRQAQKMEAVGQLTAGIAHDFNNMLGAVVGNLDLVGEHLAAAPADTEAAARHAHEALNAALSGAELVKRLLAFARQQPLHPQPMDLKETIAGVVPLLRPTLGDRIAITTTIAPDLWPAVADATQIESALINLVLNARDAMPQGGQLTLAARNVTVAADPRPVNDNPRPGNYVEIAVIDDGTGMSPEAVAHAFEPFFTTKDVGAGSGLGLSMVLGTMQQLGGTARITSAPGQGTTIRLFLPRAAPAQCPAPPPTAPAQPIGTERILLVEDNALIRESVQVMMQNLGYGVEAVENADAALALWDRGAHFDLVFSDIIMPGQHNGVALARALRARDPHVKILLTSGFANAATLGDGMEAMDLEVLQKPYRKAVLAARLRTILDRTVRA